MGLRVMDEDGCEPFWREEWKVDFFEREKKMANVEEWRKRKKEKVGGGVRWQEKVEEERRRKSRLGTSS